MSSHTMNIITFVSRCSEVLSQSLGTPKGLHFVRPFGMYTLFVSNTLVLKMFPILLCFLKHLSIINLGLEYQCDSTCCRAAMKAVLDLSNAFILLALLSPNFPALCLSSQILFNKLTRNLLYFLFL